jgi:hypothetical protein
MAVFCCINLKRIGLFVKKSALAFGFVSWAKIFGEKSGYV